MKDKIKFYEFASEQPSVYRVIDNISVFISLPIIPLFLYYVVYIFLEKIIGENFLPSVLHKTFMIIAVFLGILWLIKYKTSLKGVWLYDNYLQIDRHFFSKRYTFNLNPKIKYDDIESCSTVPKKPRNNEEWNEMRIYPMGGVSNEYIRIETKYGNKYLFSVENQKDFADELIKRANLPGNSRTK